jgi:hypothetical protein
MRSTVTMLTAALGVCVAAISTPAAVGGRASHTIVVSSAAALKAALVDANAGRRILVRRGVYELDVALRVPAHASLEGEGSGATVLKGLPVVAGDVVTLGDGTTLRRLAVEDAAGRRGNVVAVGSRRPGDTVTATIVDCRLVTPNPIGAAPNGPVGVALTVLTNNLNRGDPPAADAGARVRVRIERSVLRAGGRGFALFAANFAPRGRIALEITRSELNGTVEISGGISRPDEVSRASVVVDSRRNTYALPLPGAVAWSILGGTGPPFRVVGVRTFDNAVRVDSRRDRIAGALTGIQVHAGRRFDADVGASSHNRVDLRLRRLTIGSSGADLVLEAAVAFAPVAPGDGNVLHVDMRRSSGTGRRANRYAHSRVFGPPMPGTEGTRNRLAVAGTPRQFARTNEQIDPAPPPRFFTMARGRR